MASCKALVSRAVREHGYLHADSELLIFTKYGLASCILHILKGTCALPNHGQVARRLAVEKLVDDAARLMFPDEYLCMAHLSDFLQRLDGPVLEPFEWQEIGDEITEELKRRRANRVALLD